MGPTSPTLSTHGLSCATSPNNIPIASPRRVSRSVYCDHGQLCTLDETADDAQNMVLDVKYGVEESCDRDLETYALEINTDTETESSSVSGSWDAHSHIRVESIETEYDADEELKKKTQGLYVDWRAYCLLTTSDHSSEVQTISRTSHEVVNGCASQENKSTLVPAQDQSSTQKRLIHRSSIDSGYSSSLDHSSAGEKYNTLHFSVDEQASAVAHSINCSCYLEQQPNRNHDGEETTSCPRFGGLLCHLKKHHRKAVFRTGSLTLPKMTVPSVSKSQRINSTMFPQSKSLPKDYSGAVVPVNMKSLPINLRTSIFESKTSLMDSSRQVTLCNSKGKEFIVPGTSIADLCPPEAILVSKFSLDAAIRANKIDLETLSTRLVIFPSHSYMTSSLPTPSTSPCSLRGERIRPCTRGRVIRIPSRNLSRDERRREEQIWMESMREDESDSDDKTENQRRENAGNKKRKRGPGKSDDGREKQKR